MVKSVESENNKELRYHRFNFWKSVRKSVQNFKLTFAGIELKSEIRRSVRFKPL